MTWVLLAFLSMGLVAFVVTEIAWRAMNKVEDSTTPCEHPWYIDGRCMVCGTPK